MPHSIRKIQLNFFIKQLGHRIIPSLFVIFDIVLPYSLLFFLISGLDKLAEPENDIVISRMIFNYLCTVGQNFFRWNFL